MKHVLITGANSFLGDNTKQYLEKSDDYRVDILDMLDSKWEKHDFSKYDVVLNVCAIVHRYDNPDESLYYMINKDLAINIAKKAKSEGVRQFIQISTIGVFGVELGPVDLSTGLNPQTPYEKSKLSADLELAKLRNDGFAVCILRPPIIYGNGCKGNFPKLVNFAKKHSIFPSF